MAILWQIGMATIIVLNAEMTIRVTTPVLILQIALFVSTRIVPPSLPAEFSTRLLGVSFATKTMNGAYWRGHMTIGGLPTSTLTHWLLKVT